jgi:hypothetical protein
MKIHVSAWYDAERSVVILRWAIFAPGMIGDCVKEVRPGGTAFGRTYEELQTRGSFEAQCGADD